MLTPSTRRLATWSNSRRLQRRPRYAVPVVVLSVPPQTVRGAPRGASGCRSESGRPAHATCRRQVRHPRRGGRRAVRTGGAVDGHPEDRGRCRRDDAPAEDHAGHRSEGAHHGDEHAEADRGARPRRHCEKPSTTSPITACSRAAPDSDRAPSTRPPRPPSTPSGPSPAAGWLSPRKWRYTTSTSHASRPKHYRCW